MIIEKIDHGSEEIDNFIDRGFTQYADKNGVVCDYKDFCFVARDGGKIVGVITGHSYYNEVHIGDLIVDEEYRGQDIGSRLVQAVEKEYEGGRHRNINLTTYAFQAPEFYKKLGFQVEYIRESSDPKLTKYFLVKYL